MSFTPDGTEHAPLLPKTRYDDSAAVTSRNYSAAPASSDRVALLRDLQRELHQGLATATEEGARHQGRPGSLQASYFAGKRRAFTDIIQFLSIYTTGDDPKADES